MNSRFLSLFELAKIYHFEDLLSSPDQREEWIVKVKENHRENFPYTEQEVLEFINSLDVKTFLFQSWIEASSSLKNILHFGRIETTPQLPPTIEQHAFFEEFVDYLSPFLYPILKAQCAEGIDIMTWASFIRFTSKEERKQLEMYAFHQLFPISTWKTEVEQWKAEMDFHQWCQGILSKDRIQLLNLFSNQIYFLKLELVNFLQTMIEHPLSDRKFALWWIKELQLIELQAEHKKRVDALLIQLRTNDTRIKKLQRKQKLPWKKIGLALVIGFFIFGLTLIFVQLKNKVEPENMQTSSFSQFTVEERKHLDSIIQHLSKNGNEDIEHLDPNLPFYGVSESLYFQASIKNKAMQQLIDDLKKDWILHEKNLYQSTSKGQAVSRFTYQDLIPLEQKTKGKFSIWKNDSDYDVLVLVYEEKGSGYVAALPSKKELQFNLNQEDHFLILAGLQLETRNPLQKGDQPSKKLNVHFRKIDANFEKTFQERYLMEKSSTSKFLIAGKKGERVDLIDVNAVAKFEQ